MSMKAIYLSGDSVYLRAFIEADKDQATAWADGPWPINSVRGEEILNDWHKSFWPSNRHYAICRQADDEVIGQCKISSYLRAVDVDFNVAPWVDDADGTLAEVMKLVVPWLSVEWDYMNVTVTVPGDRPKMAATAEELGMECHGSFRQFYARPGGERADCLFYQKLNGKIEVPGA